VLSLPVNVASNPTEQLRYNTCSRVPVELWKVIVLYLCQGNQYALCVPAIVVIIRRFNVFACQPVFDVKKASENMSATMCSDKIL
jgi:hypothetical protein